MEVIEKLDAPNVRAKRVLRISVCTEPAVPAAEIILYKSRDYVGQEILEKGVISYNKAHKGGTPKAGADVDWDAGKEVAKADVDDLKVMCTWFDSEFPDSKTSYKLPHHLAGGKHSVVRKAIIAAGNALRGARGGIKIPSADKKGCQTHLQKHYHEFDLKAPWEAKEKMMKEKAVELYETLKNFFMGPGAYEETMRGEGPQEFSEALERDETEHGYSKAVFLLQMVLTNIALDREKDTEEKEKGAKKAVGEFSEFVLDVFSKAIIEERGKAKQLLALEKEGRKISEARLKKLKAALNELLSILKEVEGKTTEKGKEGEMEKQDLEDALKPVLERLDDFEGRIKVIEEKPEAKPEEKPGEPKEEETEEQKVEREKAEKEQADKDKKEKERLDKEHADKEKAQIEEALKPLNETLDKLDKRLSAIEEKSGIKKGLEEDPNKDKVSGDPFRDTLKGKTKKD